MKLDRRSWPSGWPRYKGEWVRRGGTVGSALAFAEAGWPAATVSAATADLDDLSGFLPGPQSATWRRLLGGFSPDGLRLDLPELDHEALLLVGRTHPGGEHEVWEVVRIASGQAQVAYHRKAASGEPFATMELFVPATDIVEALDQLDPARTLSGHAITVLLRGVDAPPAQMLLRALRVDESVAEVDPSEWPELARDEWGIDLDRYSDLEWHNVWASIDDLRVLAVGTGGAFVPVLYDGQAEDLVPVQVLATQSWYVESDGAPFSGDGGSALWLLNEAYVLDHGWGDIEQHSVVSRWPQDPGAQAGIVANWVTVSEAQTAAAIALVPLDLTVLGEDDARSLQEDLEALTFGLDLDLPTEVIQLLAVLLDDDPIYAATAAALRDPASSGGQRFRTALSEAVNDGLIGELSGWSPAN